MVDAKRERVFGGNLVERLSIFGTASNRTEIDNHLCCGLGRKRFGQRTLRRNNEYKNTCHHPNRLNLFK